MWQVVLSCDKLTDDELVTKLRSCFSHTPTMNEAREELWNMRQLEHESVSVYMYRWGRALYQSSGIWPDNERHPHVIKDFISSLKRNIRNKVANRWAEMWHPPSTIEKAFKLASDVEKQLQVTDSFKLEFPSYPFTELNEMSAEETSGDETELNEISRGKKWGNNNNCNQKHSSFSNNHSYNYKPQQNRPQDSQQGKQWGQRPKDSKITLTQELDHYIPTELSSNLFRQFDLAMKLKQEELKKQQPGKQDYWGYSHPGLWCNWRPNGESCNDIEQEWQDQKIGKFVGLTSKKLQGWGYRWQFGRKGDIFYKHRKNQGYNLQNKGKRPCILISFWYWCTSKLHQVWYHPWNGSFTPNIW